LEGRHLTSSVLEVLYSPHAHPRSSSSPPRRPGP
jgi:hypothetical protein